MFSPAYAEQYTVDVLDLGLIIIHSSLNSVPHEASDPVTPSESLKH